MKRSPLVCFALLALIVAGASGCATTRQNTRAATLSRPRSFALAVTVRGTLQPTPQQWAGIQARFARALAAQGWVLVTDIALADHIIRIDFVPDIDDPENKGIAKVIGVRNNPLSTVARRGTSPYPSSGYGYASSFMSSWPQSNFYSAGYYGYSDYYYDGYPGGGTLVTGGTTTPPSTTNPHHHHHHQPGTPRNDCPPPLITTPSTGGFVSNDPVNDHPRPHPRDYGRMAGEYVPRVSSSHSSYSNSSYSRSDSYSSGSSYSPSHSAYESSYTSYSPPVSSYSADTSSSSSTAATAASISSSAPSVGTVSSAH